MGYERSADSRIREAMEAGAFENLPGAGKPLRFDDAENLAGDNWLGFHILSNAGLLPEYLDRAREIEDDLKRLKALDERHALLVRDAVASGNWSRVTPALERTREQYEQLARQIRARQDQQNVRAPSIRAERPAIWVEHELERLDRRVREARA